MPRISFATTDACVIACCPVATVRSLDSRMASLKLVGPKLTSRYLNAVERQHGQPVRRSVGLDGCGRGTRRQSRPREDILCWTTNGIPAAGTYTWPGSCRYSEAACQDDHRAGSRAIRHGKSSEGSICCARDFSALGHKIPFEALHSSFDAAVMSCLRCDRLSQSRPLLMRNRRGRRFPSILQPISNS